MNKDKRRNKQRDTILTYLKLYCSNDSVEALKLFNLYFTEVEEDVAYSYLNNHYASSKKVKVFGLERSQSSIFAYLICKLLHVNMFNARAEIYSVTTMFRLEILKDVLEEQREFLIFNMPAHQFNQLIRICNTK